MSPEIANIIVRHTNKKAEEVIAAWNVAHPDNVKVWQPVTEKELYAFFGLVLHAGLYNSNKEPTKQMWSTLNHPIYRATMSQVRFKAILKYIRFDNANTRTERIAADKAAPISEIWLMLNANLAREYVPGESITVGEQLFPFRGRTRFTQYMASKPAKYGIKVWWVCDATSFYPLKGQIYTGKLPNQQREVNQGERVVLDLVRDYVGCGRTVYTDNFFTSITLAEQLMTQKTALVGTIRQNKRCIPMQMRFEKSNPRKIKEFETLFAYNNNDFALCSYAPKDKKVVTLLSTVHYANIVQLDGKRKPLQILDYNQNKCGVSSLDIIKSRLFG